MAMYKCESVRAELIDDLKIKMQQFKDISNNHNCSKEALSAHNELYAAFCIVVDEFNRLIDAPILKKDIAEAIFMFPVTVEFEPEVKILLEEANRLMLVNKK